MQALRPIDIVLITAVVGLVVLQVLPYLGSRVGENAVHSSVWPESHVDSVSAAEIPDSILVPISGTVVQADEASLVVATNGRQVDISVEGDVLVRVGELKDAAAFELEMAAFREYSNSLLEDIEKNRFALSTLISPSPDIETPVALNDLKPGDIVSGYVVEIGNSVIAVSLTVE